MKLTQARLKELLDYDPETGVFTNRVTRGGIEAGKVVGCDNGAGYLQMRVDKRLYKAHRLVFLYVEGYLPENQVDHLNGTRWDNRWVNLRHVSRACNLQNQKVYRNNTSGFPGVYWRGERGRWVAKVTVGRKNILLGAYKSKLDAALARLAFEVNSPKWTCNFRGELVKAIKVYWPEFDMRSTL